MFIIFLTCITKYCILDMPSNKILTDYEKGRIDEGFADGKSQRQIALSISRSQKVVSNYLRNKEGYGTNRKGGRPCINNERVLRALGRAARSNKGKTALQLKEISGASGVKSTITRALRKKCRLKITGSTKILSLTKQHKLKRIAWAKEYIQNYSNNSIIWSDEKRFCFKGPDGYFKAWLGKNEIFKVCKERFCGGVHVWAAFVKDAIIGPYFLEKKQTFNSKKLYIFLCMYFMLISRYTEILEETLLPFLNKLSGPLPIFQHDNATPHVSRTTLKWFAEKNIVTMTFPPCSPDLNPIENL